MFMDRIAEALTGRVLDIVLPPLVTAIAALVVAVLTKQLKKIGLTVTEQQRESMKTTVKDAIIAVEEEARHAPVAIPGAVKEERAIEIAKTQLPKATESEIRQTIKTVLPVVREQLGQSPTPTPKPSTPGTFGRLKTEEEMKRSRSRHFDKGDRGGIFKP